jgi:hypothetical protein
MGVCCVWGGGGHAPCFANVKLRVYVGEAETVLGGMWRHIASVLAPGGGILWGTFSILKGPARSWSWRRNMHLIPPGTYG